MENGVLGKFSTPVVDNKLSLRGRQAPCLAGRRGTTTVALRPNVVSGEVYNMEQEKYHDKLKRMMDEYVHFIYFLTKKFPKEELFGVTSQIRRATLSIILNYIEGFARIKNKVNINFLEISYGSLQESKYLLEFSFKEGYIIEKDYLKAKKLAEEIGAMLWGTMDHKRHD